MSVPYISQTVPMVEPNSSNDQIIHINVSDFDTAILTIIFSHAFKPQSLFIWRKSMVFEPEPLVILKDVSPITISGVLFACKLWNSLVYSSVPYLAARYLDDLYGTFAFEFVFRCKCLTLPMRVERLFSRANPTNTAQTYHYLSHNNFKRLLDSIVPEILSGAFYLADDARSTKAEHAATSLVHVLGISRRLDVVKQLVAEGRLLPEACNHALLVHALRERDVPYFLHLRSLVGAIHPSRAVDVLRLLVKAGEYTLFHALYSEFADASLASHEEVQSACARFGPRELFLELVAPATVKVHACALAHFIDRSVTSEDDAALAALWERTESAPELLGAVLAKNFLTYFRRFMAARDGVHGALSALLASSTPTTFAIFVSEFAEPYLLDSIFLRLQYCRSQELLEHICREYAASLPLQTIFQHISTDLRLLAMNLVSQQGAVSAPAACNALTTLLRVVPAPLIHAADPTHLLASIYKSFHAPLIEHALALPYFAAREVQVAACGELVSFATGVLAADARQHANAAFGVLVRRGVLRGRGSAWLHAVNAAHVLHLLLPTLHPSRLLTLARRLGSLLTHRPYGCSQITNLSRYRMLKWLLAQPNVDWESPAYVEKLIADRSYTARVLEMQRIAQQQLSNASLSVFDFPRR